MLLASCSTVPEIRYKTIVKTEFKRILPPPQLLVSCNTPQANININEDLIIYIEQLYKSLSACNHDKQQLREWSNDN